MTKVSVITTFYNASSTIRGTIESIIESDFDDFEIILVDDGSNDDSNEIISEINDSRIRLYKPGRIGRSSALNLGLEKAIGKYIAILDADDLCISSRLSIQASILDNHSEYSLVYSNAELIDLNGDFTSLTSFPEFHDEIVKCLLDLNPFPHSSVMYRRECAQKIGGYNTRCEKSIDYNFYLELLSEGLFFKGLKDPLIQLRNHENSWGKNDTKALQMRYGILGLINFYQKQHNLEAILELDGQKWKASKLIFDSWFSKMRFQQQIQAKHLFAAAKNNLRNFYFLKASKKLLDLIMLDPWFWSYRGCNFNYFRDVNYFIEFLDKKLKTNRKI